MKLDTELKRNSQQPIGREQAQDRPTFRNTPGALFRCLSDAERTMILLGESFEILTGYHPEDVIENKDRSFASLIHPDDAIIVGQALESIASEKSSYSLDYRITRMDGETIWVNESAVTSFDKSRNALVLEGTIFDISDKVQASQRLTLQSTEQEKRTDEIESRRSMLRTIIDNIPDVVYVKDLESRFVNANIRMANLFNKDSIDDIIGKTDFDFCEKELAQEYFEDEQKMFKTGKPIVSKEEPGRDEYGNLIYMMVSKIPMRDENGAITGLVGIGRNVTEITLARQKVIQQAEALKSRSDEIELQRNQLQTLIDNLPDFIYFKDAESRFINGNNQFYEGLNATSMEEIVGKSDSDFFDKETATRFANDEKEIMAKGKPISKEEPGFNKDGLPIFLQTTKTPIHDPESGEIIGLVGISRDVTELTKAREDLMEQSNSLRAQKEELTAALNQLKKAQTKLVQSEKMASLGVLTAGIAHEINNPINFVYAGVNSMVKDFDDVKQIVDAMKELKSAAEPAEAIKKLEALREEFYFDEAFEALEETLKDIKLGATRITEIVAGLSKFSRMGRESWQVSNIHEDLDSVLVLLKNKYKTNISIKKQYDENLPKIECFPGKLNQAFMNLVSNAIDAIYDKGKSGTVEISTSFDSDTVTISVKDDGIGMNGETRSKILDPFFTTKEVGRGVGLGLSITHSIIEDHNATLTIHTEEGEGSEFQITLPIRQKK